MPNEYSSTWHEIFLDAIPTDATEGEVAFVTRQLPLGEFPHVLDLCCGPGRHTGPLARMGYRVHGVDMDEAVIRRARNAWPDATFETGDMRNLRAHARPFDGVVNLWHSFGYFDDETNLGVLRRIRSVLRPGGRAIFDIYNREYCAGQPPEAITERDGRRMRTLRTWHGKRQRVTVSYDGESARHDEFEWRLYEPDEFVDLCASVGLTPRVACAWFDEAKPPSPEHARMQFVVERTSVARRHDHGIRMSRSVRTAFPIVTLTE